jgi:hypothetical protein
MDVLGCWARRLRFVDNYEDDPPRQKVLDAGLAPEGAWRSN